MLFYLHRLVHDECRCKSGHVIGQSSANNFPIKTHIISSDRGIIRNDGWYKYAAELFFNSEKFIVLKWIFIYWRLKGIC